MQINKVLHAAYDKQILTDSHILLLNGIIRAYYPHNTFNIFIVPFDQALMPNEFQLEIVGMNDRDTFFDVPIDADYDNNEWYENSHYAEMLEGLKEIVTISDIDGDDYSYINIEFTPRPL